MKIVEVSWIDANCQHDVTEDLSELPRPTPVKTFGLLLLRDKECVIVGSERLVDMNGKVTWRDVTAIPMGMSPRVRVLGEVDD